MDSKYASVGNGKEEKVSIFKRKSNFDNVNVKKNKLNHLNKSQTNGHVVQVQHVQSENDLNQSQETVEDYKLTRKHLPVYLVKHRLLDEIRKHQTMILIGETGSGKTTQIPQLIHEQRLEGVGCIAVTQPRRVAAITIATRVAKEMSTEIGCIVGYCVRFEDVTSPRTKLKYMTDGMLLREAIIDPLLNKYTVIILDEAHERTISTDVLFGIVKLAQKERLDKKLSPLKVIVMSATMDVDVFRSFFDNCPAVWVEGRAHPVTVFHAKDKQHDYMHAALCTVFQLHATMPHDHDFLVFLTGQEEIETVMHNIKKIAKEIGGPPLVSVALYAALPPSRQQLVWRPPPQGARKVVLATNVAEASVTIPRIRVVIDTGMVKERTWCTVTGAERLRVVSCAQAAGWQRAGRAGRTHPGRAYRLYTAADFNQRAKHQEPEILRCPLSSTLLQLLAAGRDPASFPLPTAPPSHAAQASLALLARLGAVESEQVPRLSALGRKMATFPIDPKYSKLLLSAPDYHCLDEALSLVAIVSSESVYHSPLHRREEATRAHAKFVSNAGDHLTLLNVYRAYCQAVLKKQWCKENYLNHRNLEYACAVRAQLLSLCERLRLPVLSCEGDTDQLLKCLLTGLFTNVATLRGGAGVGAGRYVTSAGAPASLHPSSSLHPRRPPPPCVLYTELLHTTRTYLVTASAINDNWLHQLAPHYAKPLR